MKKSELRIIKKLESIGWVYGYFCGHGDSEYVTKIIDDKKMVVADIEKSFILCPPGTVYKIPRDYEEVR